MKPATAAAGLFGGGVGLVAFLLTAGLPDDVKATAEQAKGWVATARADLAAEQKRLDAVVAEDQAYLGPRPEVAAAKAAYAQRAQAIDGVAARIDKELLPLIEADKRGDADKIAILATELAVGLQHKPAEFDQKLSDVYRVRNYKRDHPKIVKGARDVLKRATETMGDPNLTAAVQHGQNQYPDVSEKIQDRLETLAKQAGKLANHGAQLDAALQVQPPDYVKVGKLADFLQMEGRAVIDGATKLRTDVASLGKSVDKILIDMKEENGQCYHKYRYVEGGLGRIASWDAVPCSVYRKHTDHLGMALFSKPEGTFESEAVTIAHPPGYSYIGNTRYGRWDTHPSGRVWVWYGQYALTRDLLWGVGGYRPISRNTYNNYRSRVKARKPYFGATKQYGTNGSYTKTKYRSSAFLTQKRKYAASRFKTSGGSGYRDFKSGSGSGSRRSGGYRSNRYRSSSFGGSGK